MGAMGMNLPKVMFFSPSFHDSSTLFDANRRGAHLKLVTVADEKTVIAEFHRPNYYRNKQKARIEVQPAGMGMLDYIVLTFVFVDQARREREAGATSTVPWLIS